MNLTLIIILILILVMYYLYENLKNEYKTKCTNLSFWKNKYKDHHKKLIDFIKEITYYLDKHKIKYWAHAGTLLGIMRHGGFIPWDDDVDLGFLNEIDSNGKYVISNLIEDLKLNGYFILHFHFGFQIYHKSDHKVFIDMFKFNLENDQVKQTIIAEMIWPKENYYLKELFPLKIANFGDTTIPIPNKSEDFCIRAFGKDYMDIFYINGPHPFTLFDDLYDGLGIYTCSDTKYYIKDLVE